LAELENRPKPFTVLESAIKEEEESDMMQKPADHGAG
jgi:hypothetical protein